MRRPAPGSQGAAGRSTLLPWLLLSPAAPRGLALPPNLAEEDGARGRPPGSAGAAYVRFRVWKSLEICSMTGPVSGSFIHCVLFRGFSSMSSNAVGRTEPG